MMFIRLLLVLVFMGLLTSLVVYNAEAATKYVCPRGGSYGTEDGSSLANCFDGEDDVWGTGAPTAGDTVVVCGTHRIVTAPYYAFRIQVNMTYRLGTTGECGGQGRGMVYGSTRDDGTGWTYDAGENAYWKTYASFVFIVARMATGENPWEATILGNISAGASVTTLANMQTGQWFWDDATDRLWLHDNPAGVVHEVGQGQQAFATYDVASITDSTVDGGTACTGVDTTANGIFFFNRYAAGSWYDIWAGRTWGTFTVKNLRVYGVHQGVHSGGPTGNSEFTNITVQDSCFWGTRGEAIYVTHLINGGVLTAERNIIGSAGSTVPAGANGWGCEVNNAACGDAIDYNPGDATEADSGSALVQDNTITNVTGNCLVATGGGIWRRNVCTDVGNTTLTDGAAVLLQNASVTQRMQFYQNQIRNTASSKATNGISMTCGTLATNVVEVLGNVVALPATSTYSGFLWPANCKEGFVVAYNTQVNGTYGMRQTVNNNSLTRTIIWNNILTNVQFPVSMVNTTLGTFTAKNNIIDHDASQANPYSFAGSSYASKTALQAGQATWTGNLELDPLLLSATDYRLSVSSPARAAGVVTGLCNDVRGYACRPDRHNIGAYQTGSGDQAAPRAPRN